MQLRLGRKPRLNIIFMDDLIEEMLAQPPALVTNEELASYKAKAEAYTTKKIRLELEKVLNCWEHPDLAPHFLTDRIEELRKTS